MPIICNTSFQLAPSQLHAIANTFRNISVIIEILARQQQQPVKREKNRALEHTKQYIQTRHSFRKLITQSNITIHNTITKTA